MITNTIMVTNTITITALVTTTTMVMAMITTTTTGMAITTTVTVMGAFLRPSRPSVRSRPARGAARCSSSTRSAGSLAT